MGIEPGSRLPTASDAVVSSTFLTKANHSSHQPDAHGSKTWKRGRFCSVGPSGAMSRNPRLRCPTEKRPIDAMMSVMVSRGRLSVLLAFMLVLANIQCAAFCTLEPCNGSGTASTPSPADDPPCHDHHDAPGPSAPAHCPHQTVQAHAAQALVKPAFVASVVVMNLPVASLGAFLSPSKVDTLAARAPSPPNLSVLSSVVLRI
jgi:hypothetical protein